MSSPRKEQLAEGVTLWLGDCVDILPGVGRVDLVLADPPYMNLAGIVTHRRYGGVARKRAISQSVGDIWGANLNWVPLAESVATKAIAVFCSYAFIAELRGAFSLPAVALAVWHKRNAPPAINNSPRQTTEFIWLFRAGPNARWRTITDTLFSVLSANAGCVTNGERLVNIDGRATHPTQKPIAIMEPFVQLIEQNEIVCDPFMGLGTSGVAAIAAGRRFTGIEREPKYFDIACRRISEALKRPRLPFDEPTPEPSQALLFEASPS